MEVWCCVHRRNNPQAIVISDALWDSKVSDLHQSRSDQNHFAFLKRLSHRLSHPFKPVCTFRKNRMDVLSDYPKLGNSTVAALKTIQKSTIHIYSNYSNGKNHSSQSKHKQKPMCKCRQLCRGRDKQGFLKPQGQCLPLRKQSTMSVKKCREGLLRVMALDRECFLKF